MVHITRVSKKHKDTKIRGHNTSQEVLDDIDMQYGSWTDTEATHQ